MTLNFAAIINKYMYMYVPQFGNMCNLEIALCELRNIKNACQSQNCTVKHCNLMIV